MTYIGVSPSNGVRRVHTYTATGSQTTFTGASSEGITLSYTDANFMDVYQNGVLLAPADYTATSGTSVVLAEGAAASDIVTITVYDAFSVADTVSKSAGGTFDGNVAMAGTLNVAGETTLQTHLNLGDDDKIKLGASGDLEIYHSGNSSYISETGTGYLFMQGAAQIRLQSPSGPNYAIFIDGGAVELYHNNSKKFETTSTGVTVTGNIANASGDFTLDVAGDIILDADGAQIRLSDAGTQFGLFGNEASDFAIQSSVQDKDILFQGNDGGSGITALTLDMSEGGRALFTDDVLLTTDNKSVKVGAGNDLSLTSDGTNGTIAAPNGDLTVDVAGDIILDADGADIKLLNGGTHWGSIYTNSSPNNLYIQNMVSDGDIYLSGSDGGSNINALIIDMSAAGMAIFSGGVNLLSSAISFSGSISTPQTAAAIFRPSDNTLAFSTANNERMRITSSGHVGIGTTSPNDTLHVNGNVFIEGSSPEITFETTNSSNNNWQIACQENVSNALEISVGSADADASNDTFSPVAVFTSSGNVGLGTSSPVGKLTLGLNTTQSDGLYIRNAASGGAEFDLVGLGSGYSAHGASPGEVWFYSANNINIGGATGNGNHIKFLANNTVRVLIHGSIPKTQTHGVHEYFYHGSLANSQTVVNIDITSISSAGVMLIEAGYTHYTINGYGASRISTLGLYGGNILSTHDIQNISSTNGGSWSYSVPSTGTIRITKNAGSYIGGGHYWVKVTTYM